MTWASWCAICDKRSFGPKSCVASRTVHCSQGIPAQACKLSYSPIARPLLQQRGKTRYPVMFPILSIQQREEEARVGETRPHDSERSLRY